MIIIPVCGYATDANVDIRVPCTGVKCRPVRLLLAIVQLSSAGTICAMTLHCRDHYGTCVEAGVLNTGALIFPLMHRIKSGGIGCV